MATQKEIEERIAKKQEEIKALRREKRNMKQREDRVRQKEEDLLLGQIVRKITHMKYGYTSEQLEEIVASWLRDKTN